MGANKKPSDSQNPNAAESVNAVDLKKARPTGTTPPSAAFRSGGTTPAVVTDVKAPGVPLQAHRPGFARSHIGRRGLSTRSSGYPSRPNPRRRRWRPRLPPPTLPRTSTAPRDLEAILKDPASTDDEILSAAIASNQQRDEKSSPDSAETGETGDHAPSLKATPLPPTTSPKPPKTPKRRRRGKSSAPKSSPTGRFPGNDGRAGRGQDRGGRGGRGGRGTKLSLLLLSAILVAQFTEGASSLLHSDASLHVCLKGQKYNQAYEDTQTKKVAVNADGTVIAVSTDVYFDDDAPYNQRHIAVYEKKSTAEQWVQRGDLIWETFYTRHSPIRKALLSDDGNVLVIYEGSDSGDIFVFDYAVGNWQKREGEGASIMSQFGSRWDIGNLALSGDGLTIVASEWEWSSGKIFVFKWNQSNDSWVTVGEEILGGLDYYCYHGHCPAQRLLVEVNKEGSLVAIAMDYKDGDTMRGTVRVLGLNNDGNWEDIDDDDALPQHAGVHSLSLSSDGGTLAVGSNNVNVYRLVQTDTSGEGEFKWYQLGKTLPGGGAVFLSGNGFLLLAGVQKGVGSEWCIQLLGLNKDSNWEVIKNIEQVSADNREYNIDTNVFVLSREGSTVVVGSWEYRGSDIFSGLIEYQVQEVACPASSSRMNTKTGIVTIFAAAVMFLCVV